ncbi:MAG: corrinoid protein [Candidatus Marinimicrobia bacterium]|jgi:5-methyltetrahydrofolate--homocysteine methyltransferase|nr:cobalamin-binding protein [Candidatus Neomarinimicrobiota bacterium]MDP6143393.1 corrinoid protein [Candidatus Neomarinimicrobiota bacterium]MDP6261595.1 corrinoid protein [Candidatus Neomarinimicrobiota bacterium]MDP7127919.1 corrinoid protein [Candidatus Neomarinimicrobiota bacterium]MDP7464721.1 corrinoid protein [Candidatus Neomarinimicrobiota bacterium]|tara:strand:- start:3902 stop:4555 length:654 start_codon:yes stop_codon:yes gene_type:complete
MAFDKQVHYELAANSVIDGNQERAVELTQEALDNGITAKEFLDNGLISGMDVVGARFRDGDMFLPEVLLAARAMKAGMELLKPELSKTNAKSAGKVVIGTVNGDLHDVGKNIVIYMLEGAGFTVIDLGVNVAMETFISEVKQHKPDILGLSAFLTTTMPAMEKVIESLQENQLRKQVKIIVGGAPVTECFANEIGADAFAEDAGTAVIVCKKMTKNG